MAFSPNPPSGATPRRRFEPVTPPTDGTPVVPVAPPVEAAPVSTPPPVTAHARGTMPQASAPAAGKDAAPPVSGEASDEATALEGEALVEMLQRAKKNRAEWNQVRQLREELSQVELSEVLDALGAERNPRDRGKWKLDGCVIITKGQTWQNTATAVSGFGGVRLIMEMKGVDDVGALLWMMGHFGEALDAVARAAIDPNGSGVGRSKVLQLPEPDRSVEAVEEVVRYLTIDRNIPMSLVRRELATGNLYASHPVRKSDNSVIYEETRCVFKSDLAAEIRSTDPKGFKGCCAGSDTDRSGYTVMPHEAVDEEILGLTEAAVDAESYAALFPGRLVLSTNGAGRPVLQLSLALEALANDYGIRAAFDADPMGDAYAQVLFNSFYVRKYFEQRLKIDPAEVDGWLLDQQILVTPDHSPHHMFFNHGWEPELPVYHSRITREIDEEGRPVLEWYPDPDGRMEPPTIRIKVRRSPHPDVPVGEMTIPVNAQAYDYILNRMRLQRDRPVKDKDWNNELVLLGSQYAARYDELAKTQFKAGVPELPEHLARLREPPAKAVDRLRRPAPSTTPPEPAEPAPVITARSRLRH